MSSLVSGHPAWGEFVRVFNGVARHQHRYTVFQDFVTMAAISMRNAIHKDAKLEAEYLAVVKRYRQEDLHEFPKLLARLVDLLEIEPTDVLGQLYMTLELGNTNTGQFFTPPCISELMGRMSYGDEFKELKAPFVTVAEPACGAGGMILSFVKIMLSHGHNPFEKLWVECRDIDRTAALMCYLQLSLWHVPGVVIVGNTLAMESREVWYTPAHHLGFWAVKLRRRETERDALQLLQGNPAESSALVTLVQEEATVTAMDGDMNQAEREVRTPVSPTPRRQMGFDFAL